MLRRIWNASVLAIVSFAFVFAVVVLTATALGAFEDDNTTVVVSVADQSNADTETEPESEVAIDFEKQFSGDKATLFAPQTIFVNVGGQSRPVSVRLNVSSQKDDLASSEASAPLTILEVASLVNAPVVGNESAPVADTQTVNTVVTTNTTTTTNNPPTSFTIPASVAASLPDMGFDYTGLSLNQLNWCYPGQPWGPGVCSDPGLTPFQEERWWTCGWYWAHWDLEFIPLDGLPVWCGGDGDGDGTPDASEMCPGDPDKTLPGVCGCGFADTDTDGDGAADCIDGCVFDPGKTNPGVCGCGTPDTDDSDGDGFCPPIDQCEGDPFKTSPGTCDCGFPETDNVDGDSRCPNNGDFCEGDFFKLDAGDCGCGFPESNDVDNDNLCPNNGDNCEGDPNKYNPGVCGCGIPDTDTDGDGAYDCNDVCPTDPAKSTIVDILLCPCNSVAVYCGILPPFTFCGCNP